MIMSWKAIRGTILVVGVVGDVREQPPGHALAEEVRVRVHDAECHVCFAPAIEARPDQPARLAVLGYHAAARVQRFVDLAEQPRGVGGAGENLAPPVRCVPVIGRDAHQFGYLAPFVAPHGPYRQF